MNFDPKLKKDEILTNQELTELFKVGNTGGMRKSKTTNSLVIISDYTKRIYKDKWENDIFHYTGMGLEGDQSLDYKQNKSLLNSDEENLNLFLFEVHNKNEYIFKGRIKLVGEPYQQEQPDKNGNMRMVWMFPLKVIESDSLDKSTNIKLGFQIELKKGILILEYLKAKINII